LHALARLVALSTLLAAPGCDGPSRPAGPLIAEGPEVAIPTSEVQARLDEMPPARRARYASLEARRELVESSILLEMQAREAEKMGLAGGPDFQAGGKARMVQRMLLMRFHDPEGPASVSDADVRAYYDEHREEYVQPVKMRVAHITFEAPEGSPGRSSRRDEARRMRERIAREGATNPDAFRDAISGIAHTRNPDVQGAALGLLSREQLARAFTPEIAEAAWGLPPDRPSAVLASPRGFHILQGQGGQPAMDVSVEQARGAIRIILYQARMADAYREWTAQLRGRANVRVSEPELARLRIAPEAG
jgi:peptidyl-prolyl cis-trans isomerase C